MKKDLFGDSLNAANLNQNDVVFTPLKIAKMIISEMNPMGFVLDPCRGGGAFYNQLPDPKGWCEIAEGRNFYDWEGNVEWIISNPPYSDWDRWMDHSFKVAENVAYILPVGKVFNSYGRVVKIKNYGGIVRIIFIQARACGFPFGFPVGIFHFKRGYDGDTKIEYIDGHGL